MDKQNELFTVVDQNDIILGYRSRYECHHNTRLIHRVTNIAIFNAKGDILLQKRSKYKDMYPEMYTLSASGHVSKGETYEQAAEREIFEELGIHVKPVFKTKFIVRASDETEMTALLICNHNGPFKLAFDEVDSVAFYSKKDIQTIKEQLTPCAIKSLQTMNLL